MFPPSRKHVAAPTLPCEMMVLHRQSITKINHGVHGIFFGYNSKSRALNETPFQSYGVSLGIWDYTVLPATRHKWAHPALNPAKGRCSIYLPQRDEGWVYLGNHTEIVYPRTHGQSPI